jgi:hypothetical protein
MAHVIGISQIVEVNRRKKKPMKKHVLYFAAAVAGLSLLGGPRLMESVQAAAPPAVVFQAAGPSVASIQSMVDAFRAALGNPNNGNDGVPHATGRREINWDGGSPANTTTSPGVSPFDVFLLGRGARFTTTGTGFVQAPPSGLATTFNNATYTNAFQPFSLSRLFSPVGSNVTTGLFFLPGGGEIPAVVSGFGAVFADVDKSDTTKISFFDAQGTLLVTRPVPASAGAASMSFLGVFFANPLIASVKITTGSSAPGPNDTLDRDIVMMDDFIYGEPQPIQQQQQ